MNVPAFSPAGCASATPPLLTLDDIVRAEQTPWRADDGPASTWALLQQAAARQPGRIALRCVASGALDAPVRSVSYQALFERITQAANAFTAAGVGPRDAVALLLNNLPETHAALWGAQAAGIASPINPMLDASHAAAIVDATGARVLVTLAPQLDETIWHKARSVLQRCAGVHTVLVVGEQTLTDAELLALAAKVPATARVLCWHATVEAECCDALRRGQPIGLDDPCAYFHTGGTTGLPKIAVHTHRNEIYAATMLARLQGPGHVVLCGLPLFHVNGAIVTGLGAFHAGWEVVLASPQGYRGKDVLANFWRLVERFGATSFSAVPTIFATLAGLPRDGADTSSLRVAFCGAAPLSPAVAARFELAAGVPLCEGYGLTEAACISALQPAGAPRRPRSVGLRLPHQQLQAWQVDGAGRAVRACAAGETGVIGVCGPNVFPGYLHARDNAGIWLQEGWLNTGDLGLIDADGFLYLTGRAKDLIIRGGHNIDPAMIEDALISHPAVQNVAAVGQPDLHAGELPIAYVTLKPGVQASADDLLEAARGLVPERAAIPVRVVIVDQLPLTVVGKVAKAELRLRAAEHVFSLLLAADGIEARVEVIADAARGTVARVACPPADTARAAALLAGFPCAVETCAAGEAA